MVRREIVAVPRAHIGSEVSVVCFDAVQRVYAHEVAEQRVVVAAFKVLHEVDGSPPRAVLPRRLDAEVHGVLSEIDTVELKHLSLE